jgi:hypothetical protein
MFSTIHNRMSGAHLAASAKAMELKNAFMKMEVRTNGVHSCTFNWHEGLHIMVGVNGDKFNYAGTGAYTQDQAMVLHNIGQIYCLEGLPKFFPSFSLGPITVELDCNKRTVSWIYGEHKFTEPLSPNLQAPFSF